MQPRHAASWPIGSTREAVGDVRAGIEAGEFVPYYQPIIGLDGGDLLGFECLARWRHPGRGLLGPDHFIPIAEESGDIRDLSYALLTRVVRDAGAWPAHLRFSINISPLQLQDADLPLQLVRRLHDGGIAPRRFTVELTESRPVTDMTRARSTVAALRGAGIKVVLDDFGAGSAGLLALYQLPFDGLKVDRSFLAALGSEDGRMVLRAILSLASQLGMSTLIEGVESREQAEQVQALGFRRAQGFLFGRPMPAAAAARMIAKMG